MYWCNNLFHSYSTLLHSISAPVSNYQGTTTDNVLDSTVLKFYTYALLIWNPPCFIASRMTKLVQNCGCFIHCFIILVHHCTFSYLSGYRCQMYYTYVRMQWLTRLACIEIMQCTLSGLLYLFNFAGKKKMQIMVNNIKLWCTVQLLLM